MIKFYMKKIGQGLSYSVYEMDGNTVIKKPTKNIYRFSKLLFWSILYRRNLSLIKKYKPILECSKISISKLNEISNEIDLEIIGNPCFHKHLKYSQDKVIVLREYFETHSFEENCKIVDSYIENVFDTWKCGFSDVDFNFAMNSGVNSKGKVILADLNALTFDKQEILELIKTQVWLDKHSYKYLVDSQLQKYFAQKVGESLNEENLRIYWNKRD